MYLILLLYRPHSPMMQHHNITIIQLISVILSTGSTSKASKKEGNVFYHVYKRFLFLG